MIAPHPSQAEVSPFLTIAIPTYNRAAHVEAQIKKLLPQLCPEVSLCIFDNASSDATQAVVEAFGDERIQYYRAPFNCGGERNFFRCFEQCQSEWLWILGDDDPLTDDAVQSLLSLLRDQACDYIQLSSPLCIHSRDVVVESVEELFRDVNFSSLLWLSTGVYRVRSFGAFYEFYNRTISTQAPHAAIVLALLESGKGKVWVTQRCVITQPPGLAGWSTLNFILCVSQLPFYLAHSGNRRILAQRIWKEHVYWAAIIGLREARDRESVARWKMIYRAAARNLASYGAVPPWLGALGNITRIDWTAFHSDLRKAILLDLLSRCPFRYFKRLRKYTARVTAR